MPTKISSDLTCSSCGSAFRRPSNRGRMPRFCSPSCRSSAYRARTAVPSGVPPEHDAAAVGIAQDTRTSAGLLLAAARSLAPNAPMELVIRAVTMRQDADDMLAVAVRKARSHGATWEQIGQATSLAADSARGHWSGAQVTRALERRAQRAASRARTALTPSALPAQGAGGAGGPGGPGRSGGPGDSAVSAGAEVVGSVRGAEPREGAGADGAGVEAADGVDGSVGSSAVPAGPSGRRPAATPRLPGHGEQERRAAAQLALALRHLRVSSSRSARAVARHIGVSASFLSLVLAGKRLPSWEVTENFVRACDGDPDDLVRLWEQAHGVAPPPPHSPSDGRTAIRTTLRGLYLAAREPDLPSLHVAAPGIRRDQVACLVDPLAPPPSDWTVIARLVSALGGRDEDVQHLWWQAYALRNAPGPLPASALRQPAIPAAAFG